jgi:hypothetical protein
MDIGLSSGAGFGKPSSRHKLSRRGRFALSSVGSGAPGEQQITAATVPIDRRGISQDLMSSF